VASIMFRYHMTKCHLMCHMPLSLHQMLHSQQQQKVMGPNVLAMQGEFCEWHLNCHTSAVQNVTVVQKKFSFADRH